MVRAALQKVFSNRSYIILAVAISIVVFAFAVWLPNFSLIITVMASSSVSFVEAINVIFSLFLSIGTNFTIVSASYTIAIAVLFGINIAMLKYYVTTRRGSFRGKGGALGIGGLISGVFGIGCAACGTFLLTSALAIFGAAGAVAFLPFGGEEFGILGVVLIGYATYWTAKKIEEPIVCDD